MTIHPQLPLWLILPLLTGLLSLSVFIEWRRSLRFRLLRTLASIVAVLSLAVIFLRPAYPHNADQQIILLTRGTSDRLADSLSRIFPDAERYELSRASSRNSRVLSSYRDLFNHSNSTEGAISKASPGRLVAVAGEGLPAYVLDSIHNGFLFVPSVIPDGITSLTIPDYIRLGKSVTVSGEYQCSETPGMLYFSDPSGRKDSIPLSERKGNFSFAFTPAIAGQTTCTLLLTNRLGRRVDETLPLNVSKFDPLNILLLQGIPTFEMQHMKNFLSDRGHQVAMRAQLSRNVFRTEFANGTPVNLSRLTAPLLDEFDLLLVDPTVLEQISPAEKSILAAAIRNGLGMVVVFNGTPPKMPARELLPVPFVSAGTDTAGILSQGKRLVLPTTPLRPAAGASNAVAQSGSRTLSGFTRVRQGAIGYQLLRETYSMLLSGDSTGYGSLWTPLLDATSRTRDKSGSIRVISEFPLQSNEPIGIELLSNATPMLYADSVSVPPAEDVLIDGLWHATWWTERTGWHALYTQTDTLPYYVFDHNAWEALHLAKQQQRNRDASIRPESSTSQQLTSAPISLTVWWIAFLLSAGFQWLAPKL